MLKQRRFNVLCLLERKSFSTGKERGRGFRAVLSNPL